MVRDYFELKTDGSQISGDEIMLRTLISGILVVGLVSLCAYGQEANEIPKPSSLKTNSQQTIGAESLSKLLSSSASDKEKFEILSELQQNGDKSSASYLVQFLSIKGQKAGLYETTLYILSKIGDKSAVDAIKPMLYNPDIYVRRQASLTLNTLGDRSGAAIMILSLESKSRNSRSAANAALKEITGQDFTGGKSLRHLSDTEEKTALNKWKSWWKENKEAFGAGKAEDFSKVLAGEEEAMRMRYAAMEEEEKNNPELPKFDDPAKTPKATFEKFRSALLKKDKKTALSFMSDELKEKYKKFFEQIKTHLEDYAKGLGQIYFDSKLGDMLYYEMATEQDDGMASFPVHFAPGDNGNWMIIEF